MIPLGLRLTLTGGREAIIRLVMIALAVTLGTGMLLTTLAGLSAVNTQNGRYAWLETGSVRDTRSSANSDPLWWRVIGDRYAGTTIGRVDLAATGPNSPVPPGIPRLPRPGEYYVSPAMHRLLAGAPRAALAARYPGREIGTIANVALPSPASPIIVIGETPSYMAHLPGADRVHSIATVSPRDCMGCPAGVGFNANAIDLVLGVVTAALLFPILIFIGAATRLSAARREQRFAAMRLVGATPRQISIIAAVESSVATLLGVGLGFALFYAMRPAIATVPFTGQPFFTADLSLTWIDVVAVAIGVPIAAAIAARIALRRVQISPLGVTRRTTPRPPSAWRLLVMAAGLAELGWIWYAGPPEGGNQQTVVYLAGVLVVMGGLIYAGPWLTMVGARIVADRTARPGALIAGRRLADNPQTAFRAISGLVLALFVGTVAVGILTTFSSERGVPANSKDGASTLTKAFLTFKRNGPPVTSTPSLPPTLVTELDAINGVRGTIVIHADPAAPPAAIGPGLASCAQLARAVTVGRCVPGTTTAQVDALFGETASRTTRWPASTISASRLNNLPVQGILVGTDGSTAAIEEARTVLERFFPTPDIPSTVQEWSDDSSRLEIAYQRLADVVILASLPIAGCSLAVSVVAGLNDRRRPFSLLRLTGAPLTLLRRVVTLESVVPLLAGALIAIAAGFGVAELFLRAQLGYSLHAPAIGYYGVVAAGLAASLAIVGSTLPFLARTTGPEASRND